MGSFSYRWLIYWEQKHKHRHTSYIFTCAIWLDIYVYIFCHSIFFRFKGALNVTPNKICWTPSRHPLPPPLRLVFYVGRVFYWPLPSTRFLWRLPRPIFYEETCAMDTQLMFLRCLVPSFFLSLSLLFFFYSPCINPKERIEQGNWIRKPFFSISYSFIRLLFLVDIPTIYQSPPFHSRAWTLSSIFVSIFQFSVLISSKT